MFDFEFFGFVFDFEFFFGSNFEFFQGKKKNPEFFFFVLKKTYGWVFETQL